MILAFMKRIKSPTSVFPARAGMIPSVRGSSTGRACIPRESGDDPRGWFPIKVEHPYSPRERG